MTNTLHQALVPLAEAAGYKIQTVHGELLYRKLLIDQLDLPNPEIQVGVVDIGRLPGGNGTLEGEVEVVLGWLAKAGYDTLIRKYHPSEKRRVSIQKGITGRTEDFPGDTLHAALAAAVLALPREAKDAQSSK